MRFLLLIGMTSLLLGCSGASDVGEQDQQPPIAVAKVLNHPFTAQAGDATVRVRSGSEVRLSGKDSKGRGVPVLTWTWSAANPAAEAVALIKRNENTVNFSVPGTAGELQFRLTVADGNGATDEALVTVIVEEVLDPDAFLTYAGQNGYSIVAVTSAATALASDLPFRVTIEHLLDYTDLTGATHLDFALATRTQTLTGQWLQANGTGGPDCTDFRNPRFAIPLPSLIMDDVLRNLGVEHPELAVDPARIDDAVLHLRVTLTPEGSLPPGVQVGLCVQDADGHDVPASAASAPGSFAPAADGVSSLADVRLDTLHGSPTRVRDTRASALAYYRTIDDPDDEAAKRHFSGWLAQAGFAGGTTDWAAMRAALQSSATGAHAVYLNNFDLGFGRDMYLRLGACDDGTPASLAQATQGACDVYAVVINYGSLEAAARNLQPIIAVAMEYTRAPESGDQRITKFYTYAPNRRGDFDRVLSIDLDGRGEKFMPGSCTVCHGGTPRGLDADDPARYGNGGDVNATFLPWDLDSLLYSDTDPAFSNAGDPDFPPAEQDLAAAFARAPQEGNFKRLNQLAWLTYGDENRFALARDLVEGWYGGSGFPNATFDGSYVPVGWRAETEGNPADAPSIYLDVFARNCRSCHVMHVPGPSGTGQFAISSYADLAGAINLTTQLESGRMPLSRLTMDRFWLPAPSAEDGVSAAERLSEHFRDDGNDATAAFTRPGPVARIDGLGAAGTTLVRGANYPLDGRRSTMQAPNGFAWQLSAPPGSLARLSFADSAAPTLVGVDLKGDYRISLSVSGAGPIDCDEALGDGTAATTCETRTRRDSVPVVDTVRGQPLSVARGTRCRPYHAPRARRALGQRGRRLNRAAHRSSCGECSWHRSGALHRRPRGVRDRAAGRDHDGTGADRCSCRGRRRRCRFPRREFRRVRSDRAHRPHLCARSADPAEQRERLPARDARHHRLRRRRRPARRSILRRYRQRDRRGTAHLRTARRPDERVRLRAARIAAPAGSARIRARCLQRRVCGCRTGRGGPERERRDTLRGRGRRTLVGRPGAR